MNVVRVLVLQFDAGKGERHDSALNVAQRMSWRAMISIKVSIELITT